MIGPTRVLVGTTLALAGFAGAATAIEAVRDAPAPRVGLTSNCAPDTLMKAEIPSCGLVIDLPHEEVLIVEPQADGELMAYIENCCNERRQIAHLVRGDGVDLLELPDWGLVTLEYQPGWPPRSTAVSNDGDKRISYANEGIDPDEHLFMACRWNNQLRH